MQCWIQDKTEEKTDPSLVSHLCDASHPSRQIQFPHVKPLANCPSPSTFPFLSFPSSPPLSSSLSLSVSLFPPTVLGLLRAAGAFAGAGQRGRGHWSSGRGFGFGGPLGPSTHAAEQGRQLLRDGLLDLLQQAAPRPAAVLRELLEAGHGVHPEEVLVGVLGGQVELADVGLGQDGLEDVVLVRVGHDVLGDLVGVAEPAQLLAVGLQVAVHQQRVDAHADGVLPDEGDFVLQLVLDHLGRGGGDEEGVWNKERREEMENREQGR